MTHEDYDKLFEVLDNRYVLHSYCNDKVAEHAKKFANDDKRIEKLIDKFAVWDKLLWVITSTAVAGLVTGILELVLK